MKNITNGDNLNRPAIEPAQPSFRDPDGYCHGSSQPFRAWEVCSIFLLFLCTGFLIHFQGFNSPMIYDSKIFIENNAALFSRHNLREVMAIVPVRPLFMGSLYLNYLLAGMNPFYFRLANLVIMAATGLVVVVLINLALSAPGARSMGTVPEKKWLSALVGLWFVVHPLQTLVVLYIWQREAIMACFFYFASMAAYFGAREGHFSRTTVGYTLSAILFFAGLLSKENLVTLPAVLFIAELTLFQQDRRDLLRRAMNIVVITIVPVATYVLLAHGMHKADSLVPQGILDRLWKHYEDSGLTPFEVFFTECRVAFYYLASIVFPYVSGTPLLKAETVSTSMWNPPVTALAVAGVGMAAGSGLALIRRKPLYSFGILFFLVVLVPESMLVPMYLFFGYRAILPMAGVLFVMAGLLLALVEQARTKPRGSMLRAIVASIAVAPIIGLGALTCYQSRNWTPFLFWKAAFDGLPPFTEQVEQVPYLQVLANFGIELVNSGNNDEAVKVLSRAAALAPDVKRFLSARRDSEAHRAAHVEIMTGTRDILKDHPGINTALFYLGTACIRSGRVQEGVDYLQLTLRRDPRHEAARLALAMALIDSGNREQGIDSLVKAVESNPRNAAARVSLGAAYRKGGNRTAAIEQYSEAVKIDPSMGQAYLNLASMLEESGNMPLAVENFRKAAHLMPQIPEAHFLLANALLKSGRESDAIQSFKKSVELRPDYAEAWANMGVAFLASGMASEAVDSFQRALSTMKNNVELHNAMGAALAEQGQADRAKEYFKRALELQPDHQGARDNLRRLESGGFKPSSSQ